MSSPLQQRAESAAMHLDSAIRCAPANEWSGDYDESGYLRILVADTGSGLEGGSFTWTFSNGSDEAMSSGDSLFDLYRDIVTQQFDKILSMQVVMKIMDDDLKFHFVEICEFVYS